MTYMHVYTDKQGSVNEQVSTSLRGETYSYNQFSTHLDAMTIFLHIWTLPINTLQCTQIYSLHTYAHAHFTYEMSVIIATHDTHALNTLLRST